jgi:hypothetical protein
VDTAYSIQCVLLQPIAAEMYTPYTPAPGQTRTERSAYEIGARITCLDRTIIRRYYSRMADAQHMRLTMSGAHAGRLQAHTRLPQELERKLSPLSPGFRRALDGADIVLIEVATNRVVDVMKDAGTSACGIL